MKLNSCILQLLLDSTAHCVLLEPDHVVGRVLTTLRTAPPETGHSAGHSSRQVTATRVHLHHPHLISGVHRYRALNRTLAVEEQALQHAVKLCAGDVYTRARGPSRQESTGIGEHQRLIERQVAQPLQL